MKALFWFVLFTLLGGVAWAGLELTSARLYYKQKEWDKAVEFYNQAAEKEPGNLEVFWERGRLIGEIATDPERADFAKKLAGDAADVKAELFSRMIADFERAQKTQSPEDEKVLKKFKKQLDQLLDDHWFSFYNAALGIDTTIKGSTASDMTDEEQAQLRKSISDLDVATRLIPSRWNAYGQKAQVLERLGDIAGADAAWRAAQSVLEQSKDDKKGEALVVIRQHLLANGYELEQYHETVALADEILAKDAANMDAVQYKAFALARLAGDTTHTQAERDQYKAEAIKALDAARAARKDDPVVVYYMGQFNLELGDTTAAMKSFQDYLTMEPEDKDVLFALGVIYLEGGSHADNGRAIELFKKLTDAHKDFQPGWQNLGVALVRAGKTAEAKEALTKARELDGK